MQRLGIDALLLDFSHDILLEVYFLTKARISWLMLIPLGLILNCRNCVLSSKNKKLFEISINV